MTALLVIDMQEHFKGIATNTMIQRVSGTIEAAENSTPDNCEFDITLKTDAACGSGPNPPPPGPGPNGGGTSAGTYFLIL